jgi:hypothetical protein
MEKAIEQKILDRRGEGRLRFVEKTLDRKLATEPGFVSIPTGSMFGKPTFMTGYYHGERDRKGKPLVEFIIEKGKTATVAVDETSMYEATDHEATAASKGRNGLTDDPQDAPTSTTRATRKSE